MILFSNLNWPVKLWLYKDQDGSNFTTIQTKASQEARLITSQLPMRGVTYFPNFQGDAGQVTIV
jgi:hypothetical protein